MSERASPFTISVCQLILLCSDTSSDLYEALTISNETQTSTGISKSSLSQISSSSSFTLLDMIALLQRIILTDNDLNSNGGEGGNVSSSTPPLLHLLSEIKMGSPRNTNNSGSISTRKPTERSTTKTNQNNQSKHNTTTNTINSIPHIFYKTLTQSASSIDSLIDLFSNLQMICKKGVIDKNSAQGIYIRRISLGFEELPFEAVGKLWIAFHEYVQQGAVFFDHVSQKSCEKNHLKNCNHFPPDDFIYQLPQSQQQMQWKPSSPQIERTLYKKCLNFHQNVGKPNHSYEQIEAGIQNILTQHPELPAAHFLRFLNCLHHREHVGAIDSLHRYFDYAMIHERREAMAIVSVAAAANAAGTNNTTNTQGSIAAAVASSNDASNNNKAQDGRTSVVQYAAILLAALHYEFGNDFLSNKATEEAIRVAQQSGDTACVAYALAWLHHNYTSTNSTTSYHLSSSDSAWLGSMGASNDTNDNNTNASRQQTEELLKRSYNQALHHNLSNLAFGAHLGLARYYSTFPYSGRNIISSCANFNYQPKDAWESLEPSVVRLAGRGGSHHARHASHSNLHHRRFGSSSNSNNYAVNNATDGSKHIADHESLNDSLMILSRQHLVASGVWETFGHAPLAALTAVSALHCYGDSLSTNEFTVSIHKIAMGVLHGSAIDLTPARSRYDGKVSFESIRSRQKNTSLSRKWIKGITKESNHNHECVYQDAIKKLLHIKQNYPSESSSNPTSSIWTHSMTLVLHAWALNRNEFTHSYALNTLLQTSSTLSQRHRMETTIQSLSQYVLSLCHMGSWKQAFLLTKRLCITCQSHGLRFHHARLLLQLTLLQLQQCTIDVSTITSSVLPPLLECLSLCDNFSMDSLHAAALSLLAKVYLLLDHPKKAKSILTAVIPLLLQHAPLELQGEAWLTLAKCSMRELSIQFSLHPLRTSRSDSARSSTGSKPHPTCRRLFHMACSQLEESILVFKKIQHVKSLRESFYLLARLCHSWEEGGESIRTRAKQALKGYREMCGHAVASSTWPISYDAFLGVIDVKNIEKLLNR